MTSIISLTIIAFLGLTNIGEQFFKLIDNLSSNVLGVLKRTIGTLTILFLGLVLLSNLISLPEPATSDMEQMSNEELREVSGQELLDFTIEQGQTTASGTIGSYSTSCGWHCSNTYTYNFTVDNTDQHFTRLGIDARIEITGDDGSGLDGLRVDDLKAGHYDNTNKGVGSGDGGFMDKTTCSGGGSPTCTGMAGESFYHGPAFNNYNGMITRNSNKNNDGSNNNNSNSFDIDGNGLVFDVAGANAGGQKIVIEGPYVELAYENFDSSFPDLVGMRVGFEKIRGGAQIDGINQISTTIRAEDFNDLGLANCAGTRIDGCPSGVGNALSLFGELAFGSNNGFSGDGDSWTEDFWLSFNSQDIFWRHNNPAAGTTNGDKARFNTDGAGFWLHVTDDVEGGL